MILLIEDMLVGSIPVLRHGWGVFILLASFQPSRMHDFVYFFQINIDQLTRSIKRCLFISISHINIVASKYFIPIRVAVLKMNPITNLDDKLKVAAESGNIDLLYEVIQVDSSILKIIDSNQFVETPLHIAATNGHRPFAIEVMNLKPSFAWKLNQQGFSPIHLAVQNNHKSMVFCFVDMNKDLIRLKGKEGKTPLHFACQIDEVDILAEFLTACPNSIEDVTVRGETALHIAVKKNNFNALNLLVCFLKKNTKRGARKIENKILSQMDENGNTILHISTQSNQPEVTSCSFNLYILFLLTCQSKYNTS